MTNPPGDVISLLRGADERTLKRVHRRFTESGDQDSAAIIAGELRRRVGLKELQESNQRISAKLDKVEEILGRLLPELRELRRLGHHDEA